jgi:chaperonin GroES
VLFHPKNAIPVDLESDNVLFVVDIDDVMAVFRRTSVTDSTTEPLEDVDDIDA